MQAKIIEASVEFVEQPFKVPLVLSTGAITHLTEARARVRVRVGAQEAEGRGSTYLSDLWAWPDPALTHAQRDAALRELCQTIASRFADACGGTPAHPLTLGLRLHRTVCEAPGGSQGMPALARAMCLSPFDAAIHDGAGQAMGCSAFALYGDDEELPEADGWFASKAAGAAIRSTLRPMVRELAAWLVVGKHDDLERDVRPWIRDRRYRCFKIKVMGRDNAEDVRRTVEVYRAVRGFGVEAPILSIDSNEGNPDAASVFDYLRRLRAEDGQAFEALGYVEQPTGRDIREHRYDWRDVARLKPVMLDEGLTALELMGEARSQGWSGFALKTCKGHSFALVAAAWARENGLSVSFQDLTNPGVALIHAALFAAHLSTINGVELNSPQFTPEANWEWAGRRASLFAPRDGMHRLDGPVPDGLGGRW